jgi:hypothetical protein
MSVSTPSSNLGRHVFGVAALAFGLITLAWHDYNDWHQLRYIVYAAAAAQIFGGAVIQTAARWELLSWPCRESLD